MLESTKKEFEARGYLVNSRGEVFEGRRDQDGKPFWLQQARLATRAQVAEKRGAAAVRALFEELDNE